MTLAPDDRKDEFITIRLTAGDIDKIDFAAKVDGTKRSRFIRTAIDKLVAQKLRELADRTSAAIPDNSTTEAI
ncbi:MAG: hypothetical protein R3D68_07075 [Hyphomicrobiaceae bacterium]